ncbi:MAG: EAL domain-containing protein [Ectothiorhodospira sp.]
MTHSKSTNPDLDTIRERAHQALRRGEFDLAQQLLEHGDIDLEQITEQLRIYQAELEIQNAELRESQQTAEQVLGRYQGLFSGIPVAALVVDHTGLILECNDHAAQLFGLDTRHLRHHFLGRLLHRGDEATLHRTLGQAEETGKGLAPQVTFLRATGGSFNGELHVAPLPPGAEERHQFVCAVVDLTERIRQEQATERAHEQLRQSEQRYRILADYSPVWDYWFGPDGQYRYVSPACLAVCGHPPRDFEADPDLFSRLLPPEDRIRWENHERKVLEEHADAPHERMELRILRPDGEIRWIEHECRAVMGADGTYLGRRGVNRDITDRKRAELEVAQVSLLYATLSAVNQAIIRIEDEQRLLDNLVRIAVQHGGFSGCIISLCPEEGEDPVPRAMNGIPPQEVPSLPMKEAWTLINRQSYVYANRDDPGAPRAWSRWARRHGVQTFGHYPLIRGQRLVGMATFLSATREAFNPQVDRLVQDITEDFSYALQHLELEKKRRANEERLRLADQVFQAADEGIMVTDTGGHIVAVNPAFTHITGYSEDEVKGRQPSFLRSGRQDTAFYQNLWNTLQGSGHWRGEIWNRRKSGEVYPEWLTISAVPNESGEIEHYVGVFSDIGQVKEAQQQLEFMAHYDPLTGLANRVLFRDRLRHALLRAKRHRNTLVLLFIDLDRFKTINDTLGHTLGDQLLKTVARRMEHATRASDTLSRLGGDEFVLLLDGELSRDDIQILSRKLLRILEEPMHLDGHEVVVSASIGIATYPEDGEDADTLLKHADLAMYEAKTHGRNGYEFFAPNLTEGVLDRLKMESALRGAPGRDELRVHYQPQVDLRDGRLLGVEALVRWQHPALGLVPPGRFIGLAEEMGVIGEIGAWVLREACRQMRAWWDAGFHVPLVAVNLSVQQLEREQLVERVQDALSDFHLPAACLELEVTESLIMKAPEKTLSVLLTLKGMGVMLAVDDFGTGYSSLSYLKRLPLDRLKIDRSFIQDVDRDPNGEAIIRAIISLGRTLGLETVAEGIEQPGQSAFLQREGCHMGQGYLFGRPHPPEVIEEHWRESVSGNPPGVTPPGNDGSIQ